VARTDLTRLSEKARHDRAMLDALLDEALVGHLAVVRPDGLPVVLPTAIARDGDRVLLHGSTGSPWMRQAAAGAPVCLEVTAVDGLVVARSAFESSLHYRSAVLFGVCVPVTGAERAASLTVLTDHLLPGRAAEVRPSSAKELAATLVLALPIEEWSLKVSDGWPEDADGDLAGDAWAGVVPTVPRTYAAPRPAPDLRPGIPVPASVRQLVGGDENAGQERAAPDPR
jgi:nitroimidazol reductase NimA-like FMN-containing flavoprotein (pyridoxamine 5'-phosphate oxidase superfamily)